MFNGRHDKEEFEDDDVTIRKKCTSCFGVGNTLIIFSVYIRKPKINIKLIMIYYNKVANFTLHGYLSIRIESSMT